LVGRAWWEAYRLMSSMLGREGDDEWMN